MTKKSNLEGYQKNKKNYSKENNTEKNTNDKNINLSKSSQNVQEKVFKSDNAYVNHFYKFRNYYIPFLIVCLTLFVYSKVFSFDFVNWDDDRYVTGNPYLTQFTFENIKYFFENDYFVMYIPITMISYMFDYKFATLENPGFYHAHNIILHLLNSVLLFYVILLIIKKINPQRAVIFATITSFLFAIHPIHTESVSWIAERKDVLYTLYFFAAILFYMLYTNKNELKFYLPALFFFLLSLLSKTQAVTLSVTIVLIDYLIGRIDLSKDNIKKFFAEKRFFNERVINEKIPFFILSAIFGILAIFAIGGEEPFYSNFSTVQISTNEAYPFYENVLYSCYSFVHYILKILIPNNLSIIHPYPQKLDGAIPLEFWFYPIPVLLLMIYTVYAFIKKQKYIVFSILFFTSNIILMLQLASVQNFLLSEHYTYVSSTGISILLIYLYFKLIDKNVKFKPILNIFWIGYISFLTIFSFNRNDVWQNSLTLWNDVRVKYPQVIVAHYNRGNYNQELGDKAAAKSESAKAIEFYKEAILDYDDALNLQKSNIGALSNRGIVKAKLNDPQAAVADFDAVIAIDSTYGNVFSNKGNALIMLQRWDEAIVNYTNAIKFNPELEDAYYNRGTAYSSIGKFEEAIKDFEKCVELKPTNYVCYNYIGYSYFNLKKYNDALKNFENYLKYDTKNYVPYYYRALINEANGNSSQAKVDYDLIAKNFPEAIKNIIADGKQLENQGDYTGQLVYFQKAEEKYNEAIKINPKYADAYIKRGVIEGKIGNINNALADFNIAIKLDSTNFEAYTSRGFANDLLQNNEAALKDYNKAISLNNKYLLAYFNRGIIYMRIKKYEQAYQDFTTVIGLESNYSSAYLNRGIVEYSMNKNAESCADWKKCLELGNTDANIYLSTYCK